MEKKKEKETKTKKWMSCKAHISEHPPLNAQVCPNKWLPCNVQNEKAWQC